ncbi:cytochrome c [Magnetovibrio sp. PR-2]|uniref:c-type cytochrome n=1 Tax=Magnetovibrio sp. PR-2 TaxID=3120356 RepID=UPI002FCE3650
MKFNKVFPLAVVAVLVGGGVVVATKSNLNTQPNTTVNVVVPELSAKARIGQTKFNQNCVECHGADAGGSEKGPPLIHRYYEPNHHADGAFFLAAQRGVRAHHWPYGDMPPQPHMSTVDMAAIVQYVRELQKHNGIF